MSRKFLIPLLTASFVVVAIFGTAHGQNTSRIGETGTKGALGPAKRMGGAKSRIGHESTHVIQQGKGGGARKFNHHQRRGGQGGQRARQDPLRSF